MQRGEGLWRGRFKAMASPCEVLVEVDDAGEARRLCEIAAAEAWRIEHKFSRYRDDNVVFRINNGAGKRVEIDAETARLLAFAAQCYELSDGLFDVTSGVLRKAWRFDGGEAVPDAGSIEALLPRIGWSKVRWTSDYVELPQGMELDFGGIGKEYAVDRAQQLLADAGRSPALVNLGGDLAVTGARADGRPWRAGIEDPARQGVRGALAVSSGALATSGDTYRYVLKDDVRYGHVLDPRTGWPVPGAPRSVTVAAPNCTQAGMLATFALLKGAGAEAFLAAQGLPHWCVR